MKPLELERSFNVQNLIRFEQRLNAKKERPILDLDMLGYQSNAEIETMQ